MEANSPESLRLPASLLEATERRAKGMTFLGVPMLELTRGELLACAVTGWEAFESRDDDMNDLRLMHEMFAAAKGWKPTTTTESKK